MANGLVQWSDAFSIGLQEVDEQHQVLVGLLNERGEAVAHHHGSAKCREVLDRLAEYTRVHFTVEESLMRLLNYPEFADHKQRHEELIHQVVDLQQKLDAGTTAISFELLHFLKMWLVKHISESDMRFGKYAVARGVSAKWEAHVEQTMRKPKWRWKFWAAA
jgi:hemerythrin